MPSPMAPWAAVGAGRARGQRLNEAERQESIKRKLEAARIRLQAKSVQIAKEAQQSQERRLREEGEFKNFMRVKEFTAAEKEREAERKAAGEKERRLGEAAKGVEKRAERGLKLREDADKRTATEHDWKGKDRPLERELAEAEVDDFKATSADAAAERLAAGVVKDQAASSLDELGAMSIETSTYKQVQSFRAKLPRMFARTGKEGEAARLIIERAAELKYDNIKNHVTGLVQGLSGAQSVNTKTLGEIRNVLAGRLDAKTEAALLTDNVGTVMERLWRIDPTLALAGAQKYGFMADYGIVRKNHQEQAALEATKTRADQAHALNVIGKFVERADDVDELQARREVEHIEGIKEILPGLGALSTNRLREILRDGIFSPRTLDLLKKGRAIRERGPSGRKPTAAAKAEEEAKGAEVETIVTEGAKRIGKGKAASSARAKKRKADAEKKEDLIRESAADAARRKQRNRAAARRGFPPGLR